MNILWMLAEVVAYTGAAVVIARAGAAIVIARFCAFNRLRRGKQCFDL